MAEIKSGDETYVVMANDYPVAVFSSQLAAESYCVVRRVDDKRQDEMDGRRRSVPRVNWRVYGFRMDRPPNVGCGNDG